MMKCSFSWKHQREGVMRCLLTVVWDLSGCAASHPRWGWLVAVCDWSGMTDSLIFFFKYLRSWTKHHIQRASHPLGLVLYVHSTSPHQSSWLGAFSLHRVKLIAFSTVLSEVPKWSHDIGYSSLHSRHEALLQASVKPGHLGGKAKKITRFKMWRKKHIIGGTCHLPKCHLFTI